MERCPESRFSAAACSLSRARELLASQSRRELAHSHLASPDSAARVAGVFAPEESARLIFQVRRHETAPAICFGSTRCRTQPDSSRCDAPCTRKRLPFCYRGWDLCNRSSHEIRTDRALLLIRAPKDCVLPDAARLVAQA